jgi:hypothetical protein
VEFVEKVKDLLAFFQNNNITVDAFEKEKDIDFKIVISKSESDLVRRFITLYIDVH